MSKVSKILVATTATIALGSLASVQITSDKINTNKILYVQNKKIQGYTQEKNSTQSNLLPNSIVFSSNIHAVNQKLNGLNDVLLRGEISFNKDTMRINTKIWNENSGNIEVSTPDGPAYSFSLLNNNLEIQKEVKLSTNNTAAPISEFNNVEFKYNDIIALKNQTYNTANYLGIANNNNIPSANNNPNIKFTNIKTFGVNHYFKITPQGLVQMLGFYTAPNGNRYYFNNDGTMQIGWQTINGKKYHFNNDGTMQTGWQTINSKKYYFNNDGTMQTGWQTINGKKYYFNNDGTMQTGWQTINNETWYYLNPSTGVLETGWQTINNKRYYFNNNGTMQTGFKKINGSVYEFNNNGQLVGKVTIAIDGTVNKIINLGEKFNSLEGVTLKDIADPTAKIEVSGTVNTNVPGIYKLTYTATDNYGQTTSVTRDIVVKGSITKDLYWDYNSLVINGKIILNDNIISKNISKKLIIKNSNGNIVTSINTTAVNWYSNNKNSYSGYQGIFTSKELSKLKPDESYNIYIEMNGVEMPIINNLTLKSNKYTIESNKIGDLIIKNNLAKLENEAVYETDYFTDYGYVLNGNLYLNNTIFNKSDSKILVIKDIQGNIIDKVKCASMNWYSNNKENYSGFQGIFTNSELNKLKTGEKYIFELEINKNGKTYTFPIKKEKNFIVNTGINYNIETNSENDLIIGKKIQNKNINSGKITIEDKYWEPYGYVMNIKIGEIDEIPKGTKIQLVSKDPNGKVILVVNGVGVNWYSTNEKNYNGFQVIIPSNQIKNILEKNKLYVKVILNGHIKEFSI